MHLECRAGLDEQNDDRTLALHRDDRARQHISGTEAARLLVGQQDVSCANRDADRRTRIDCGTRHLEFLVTPREPAMHGSGVGPDTRDRRVEEVLESRQSRLPFVGRRLEHLLRRPLGHDRPAFQDDHVLGQGKDFPVGVRDVEDS